MILLTSDLYIYDVAAMAKKYDLVLNENVIVSIMDSILFCIYRIVGTDLDDICDIKMNALSSRVTSSGL